MTNKELIQAALKEKNQIIGCYSEQMDHFSKRSINRILKEADMMDYTDILVTNKGNRYIVEVCQVDNERDFVVKTEKDYINQYRN